MATTGRAGMLVTAVGGAALPEIPVAASLHWG